MPRDIDIIIEKVRGRVPGVKVVQMHKTHPADDDNLWWFRIENHRNDVQIEPATDTGGNCPFIIESCSSSSSDDARHAETIEEAVELLCSYLAWQQGGKIGPPPF